MARSIVANTDSVVYGSDASDEVVEAAIGDGVLSGKLDDHYDEIDMLIVALYPNDVVDTIREAATKLKKGCIVIDCTGVKEIVCSKLSKELSGMGLRFIGGHPMAGKEVAGYENSDAEMFKGASMILCKDENTDKDALEFAEGFFKRVGFGGVKITTAIEHDRVIAFTSQLAHVVSSAYIKSTTLDKRYGFSAGSFKDLTRVARLNENMWADLFLANEDAIISEIDSIINHLMEFENAIEGRDRDRLVALLREGRIRKEEDERKESEYKA